MMVMAFQSSPIFSLPRARLECSEIIFRLMRSLVLACFLLSWTGPARSDRSRPGRGISESLGTAPFWENSETSSQNIPLKGRADSRDPAEFWPQRLFDSRLSCGGRNTQLESCCWDLGQRYWSSICIAEMARTAAIFCRSKDDPAAANPATPLLSLRWTLSAKRACVVINGHRA